MTNPTAAGSGSYGIEFRMPWRDDGESPHQWIVWGWYSKLQTRDMMLRRLQRDRKQWEFRSSWRAECHFH